MYIEDTIAAISTPLGEGGVGIVRVSGGLSIEIAGRVFRRKGSGGLQSHRFYYGTIIDPAGGSSVDEVMAVLMQGPRSYTREDVLEIQCHGGTLVTQRILELVLRQGARLADPGEFTRRAFLNGRIDLVQAEAVIDVIRSKTDAALALAHHQRQGFLSKRIGEVRTRLVHGLALLEAHIDFPEEDIEVPAHSEIREKVAEARGLIGELLAGFDEGRVLREGVSVLIAGKPNVGKSSLLNTLLREKRAIVTAVPGTTRDIIEEIVNIKGLPIRLLDTAGIRITEDIVEQEGVRLTLEKIPEADLVLFMLDGSREFDSDDLLILEALRDKKYIVVTNKNDLQRMISLPASISGLPSVDISTHSGHGIPQLLELIHDLFLKGDAVDSREYVALNRVRHRDALSGASLHVSSFLRNLDSGLDPELLAVDLQEALHSVGQVTGETTPDDILDLIFQSFCIGK